MAKTLPTQLSICKNLEGLVHQVEGFLSAQQLCLFFPQGYPVKNFPNLFLMDPAAPSHQPSNWGSLLPPLSGWTNKAWRLKAALMSSKVASWDTFKVSSKFVFLLAHEGAVFDPQISGCQQKHLRTLWCIRKKKPNYAAVKRKNMAKHRPFPKRLGDQV